MVTADIIIESEDGENASSHENHTYWEIRQR